MAVTKILVWKGHLDVGINYVLNGDKIKEHVLNVHLNCDPGRKYCPMQDRYTLGVQGGKPGKGRIGKYRQDERLNIK